MGNNFFFSANYYEYKGKSEVQVNRIDDSWDTNKNQGT